MTWLTLACIALFIGRAWQHLRWDAPFRALLWNQSLMEPLLLRFTGIQWQTYSGSMSVDGFIQASIRGFGGFYLVCAFASISLNHTWDNRRTGILTLGSVSLFGLSLLYWMEHFHHIGELLEYASQWAAPGILAYALLRPGRTTNIKWALRIAIASTFIGHGLYAVGWHPVPGHFIDMLIGTLGVSESVAIKILFTAGMLDFAVAAVLLFPAEGRVFKAALIYAALWGGATAFARIVWGFDSQFVAASLAQWLHETLLRLPHAALPLALLTATGKRQLSAR